MSAKLVCLFCLVVAASSAPQKHNLPVLFQFSQPSHSVSVFRGADLKKAIAAGIVPGFGSLGNSANSADSDEDREGRSEGGDDGDDDSVAASYVEPATEAPTTVAPYVPPTTTVAPTPAPTPAPTTAPYRIVSSYSPAPVVYKPAPVVYKPAPVVYKPAPVVYKPAPVVYKPAPAPVVYKPAPAPIVYKPAPKYKAAPYVEPTYAQDALYTWEYAVKDDYTSNDFGAKEARDGALTNGKYYVALPDGRLQTVTYTVNGGDGYVPIVEYAGEAQFPPTSAPAYSS